MSTRAAMLGMSVLGVLSWWGPFAIADDNDLTLERLIGRPSAPGKSPDVTPAKRSAYAGLASELGVAIAPHAMQAADSLGWSGFAINIDTAMTQVNQSADYWQKGAQHLSSPFLSTIGVTVRKGIWLPFPSFEISVGAKKILGSNMFGLDFAAKLALHEGYHRWAIPSFAVRLAVTHLLGAPQISLTVLDVGLLVSKRFVLRRSFTLDPYLGVSALVSFVQSQIVDTTPDIDAYRQGAVSPDQYANVSLPDPDPLSRVRFHGGLQIKVSWFQFTIEGAYVLCNHSGRNCGVSGAAEVADRSLGQAQLALSLGVLY